MNIAKMTIEEIEQAQQEAKTKLQSLEDRRTKLNSEILNLKKKVSSFDSEIQKRKLNERDHNLYKLMQGVFENHNITDDMIRNCKSPEDFANWISGSDNSVISPVENKNY